MGKHYEQPIVDMAFQTRTIKVGDNRPVPPGLVENKEWMRWNNYGVALLDAQQYAASAKAFEHVAKLRPEYADAYTNLAIAEIQWQRYDDARPNLERALTLAPGNARALYYRAVVERNLGNMAMAIADLQNVVVSFPRSRDAHRELGFSYYQLHNYELARVEYGKVQSIDPDDPSAHTFSQSSIAGWASLISRSSRRQLLLIRKTIPQQSLTPSNSTGAYRDCERGDVWHTHELDMPSKPGKHPPQIIAPSTSNMSGGEF